MGLRSQFEVLEPWFTQFEFEGELFGGDNDFTDDPRLALFFQWMHQPASIMELSSFEGGHSIHLAAPSFVDRVLGLEGRTENIKRSSLVASTLGRGNIEFAHCDLDNDSLVPFGHFDAVFCTGLLYHLKRPWRLLDEIAKVTDRLFLDTHYATTAEATVEGYVGREFDEGGYSDPLSGLSATSFWLTLPCLAQTLDKVGLKITELHDHPDWKGQGPRVILAAVRS